MRKANIFVTLCVVTGIAACGGGGSGGTTSFSSFSDFADLQSDSVFATDTPTSFINGTTSRATYNGIANIGVDDGPSQDGYLGRVAATVDFGTDSMTGSITGFSKWMDDFAALPSLQKASGSVSVSGSVTGANSILGDAIDGTASGTIDGTVVAFSVEGSFSGSTAQGISLWFDGANANGVAVGID